MASVQLDKMSLKDLLDLRNKLDNALSQAQDRERSKLKQKIETLASDAGFNLAELFGSRKLKGSTVRPKYANPENPSETWSGRGRKPRWLSDKVGKGAKMDSFLIR